MIIKVEGHLAFNILACNIHALLLNVTVIHIYLSQGSVLAGLNRRRAVITNTDALEGYFTIYAEVSMNILLSSICGLL